MNELPERLPSRSLRNWFLAWQIHTGDPADVIAKGFDLDPTLVEDLLSGEVPLMLDRSLVIRVLERIGEPWSEEADSRLATRRADAGFEELLLCCSAREESRLLD